MLKIDKQKIYLHRDYVDFRKQINGLSLIVANDMRQNIFNGDLFVFCCKKKDKLKIVYWQNTGFCMWQLRLEKEKFKWPIKHVDEVICWDKEYFSWLLKGIDVSKLHLHKTLNYNNI